MRPLFAATAAVLALPACSKPVPAGYETAATAIPQAERFRQLAETCYRGTLDRSWNGAACAEAAGLHQELGLTPLHFTDDAESERYRESFAGGTNMLLKSMLSRLCEEPKREPSWPDRQQFCGQRRAVMDAQMARLLENRTAHAGN